MEKQNVNVGDVLWAIKTKVIGEEEYYYTEPICVEDIEEDYIIVHDGYDDEFEEYYPFYYELGKDCFKIKCDAENKIAEMYKEDYKKDRAWIIDFSSSNENEITAWVCDTGKVISTSDDNKVLIKPDFWADDMPAYKGYLRNDTFLSLEEAQAKVNQYNNFFRCQGYSIDEKLLEWQAY